MAFLDFIKNRQQQSSGEQTQQQKPETAKEKYSREAVQEKANKKPLDQMPADQQAKAAAVKERMEKATQHMSQNSAAPAAAPADGASSPQPMRQNMTGQDKTAPALSPTSAQRGQTEKDSPGKSNAPAETQTKAA